MQIPWSSNIITYLVLTYFISVSPATPGATGCFRLSTCFVKKTYVTIARLVVTYRKDTLHSSRVVVVTREEGERHVWRNNFVIDA